MKRKWTSPFTLPLISLVALGVGLSSCVPQTGTKARSRDISNVTSGSSNVNLYQGKILADNPIILSKNTSLSDSYDLNKLLTIDNITDEEFLKGNKVSCAGLDYCFEVRETKDSASALQTSDGKWVYGVQTPEFLQVNTFYHINKITDQFYASLTSSYNLAYNGVTPNYNTALPLNIITGIDQFLVFDKSLTAYANCDVDDNAYYDRSNNTLCFGSITGHPNVKWAQDSTVIYHETGHFFQSYLLNLRNSLIGSKAEMGNVFYDEAGAIGEGLSDFYSFFVNGRSHFAEWVAGAFLSASRPMSESDSLHSGGLSTDPDQRLSYPQYLDYNPNAPTIPAESVHNSGMILSHYLVALTADLQEKCSMDKALATNLVAHLVSETLSEHGDLNSNGIETITSKNRINLSATSTRSLDWFQKVNPINYRSFMQTMAKNLLNNLANPLLSRCNGSVYTKDQIESLMDQYGLLLFRTYNENRNLSDPSFVPNTAVSSTNRKKSVLISKDLLILDPTINASSAYVIDNKDLISSGIISLTSSGLINTSDISLQTADLGFNNNNGRVSPGEVVGIALNLYNNSNSTMGGIQILANDWNHADATGKPCRFDSSLSTDQWPLLSEGGSSCSSISASSSDTDYAPVCFIQSNESSATKWISQTELKTKMALDSSFCLNKANSKDCFIRAIKGADQARYSKLNPKSTWAQTMAHPDTGKAPNLEWGNILLFEVSKHIPPGTTIDCRLRVRFTNCDDCYHDTTRSNYDFLDKDYNGPTPFKVIHLQIPIID